LARLSWPRRSHAGYPREERRVFPGLSQSKADPPFVKERRKAMCLGVPGKIVEIDGLVAIVDFWGVRKQVRLEVVDGPVQPGDYILNHVGYAIRRIPPSEVDATLALYEELLAHAEREDDLMAADITSEIQGAGNDR
jgi:hydrogenase expression/formation protein HypC